MLDYFAINGDIIEVINKGSRPTRKGNKMKRWTIKKVEKVTGWLVEKERGRYVAKDNNFQPTFSEKKLSDLVKVLNSYNKEQELYENMRYEEDKAILEIY